MRLELTAQLDLNLPLMERREGGRAGGGVALGLPCGCVPVRHRVRHYELPFKKFEV